MQDFERRRDKHFCQSPNGQVFLSVGARRSDSYNSSLRFEWEQHLRARMSFYSFLANFLELAETGIFHRHTALLYPRITK